MIEWSEAHLAIRGMVRKFIEAEVVPHLKDLEHGDMPPYEILRKMLTTFGMRDMAQIRTSKAVARAKKREAGEDTQKPERMVSGDELAMQIIPIIELSRYSPGLVTALGVSVGLTPNTIMARGTSRQIERWV